MADEGVQDSHDTLETESESEAGDEEWEDLMAKIKEQEERKASLEHAREARNTKEKQELKEQLRKLKEQNDKSEEILHKSSTGKSTRSFSTKSRTNKIPISLNFDIVFIGSFFVFNVDLYVFLIEF